MDESFLMFESIFLTGYAKKTVNYFSTAIFIFSFSFLFFYADALHAAASTDVEPTTYSPKIGAYTSATVGATANFSALAPCPSPVNCPETTGHFSPTSINQATCPDLCTVTRDPEVVDSFIPGGTTLRNPVCPPGYSQIASFNVQSEYKIEPFISNRIIDGGLAQLTLLQQNASVQLNTNGTWSGTIHNPGMGKVGTCPGGPLQGSYFEGLDWKSWGITVVGGQVLQVISRDVDCSCGGICSKCSCNVAGTYERIKSATVKQVYYSSPGGLVPTGKQIPVSVVCAHKIQQWLSPP